MFAVERGASRRGVHGEHGIERRDIPIGAEREAHAMIQESAKRISAAGAIMADSPLRPTAVVDCMIRLDGGDHVKLGETIEVLGGHVLRMLDAKTAVGFAMSLRDLR